MTFEIGDVVYFKSADEIRSDSCRSEQVGYIMEHGIGPFIVTRCGSHLCYLIAMDKTYIGGYFRWRLERAHTFIDD